jgi:hypothetical protein
VDRLSVRSFRAHDLAERGLKELARSRLDTTRDVVFQPLGGRFLDARHDVARLAHLFREDAFHAPAGHFARMALRIEPQLVDRLASLEPRAVEARIEEATRNALLREFPRVQGVYVARFEPSARGSLEPVAHVHLSCRQSDGGPAPALSREDERRIGAAWSREVERAFGLVRGRAHEPEHAHAKDRATVLSPEAEHLRQEWGRASAKLFAVYAQRLAGNASREELVDAADRAREARAAWSRVAGAPVDLRDVDRRQVLDVVRVRIEGGSRFLRGPLEADRRSLLETAAARAANLPDGPAKRLAVVAWPAGPDLHAAVYFNQRKDAHRAPGSIEPEQLRAAIEARLHEEIRRVGAGLDATAAARAHELGRVVAQLPERPPARVRTPSAADRRAKATEPHPAAVVIALSRDPVREAGPAVDLSRRENKEAQDRLQAPTPGWSRERVFAVRLRIPTGADQLGRIGLAPDETAHVLQRAVDRAYPFLEREGIRNNFLWSAQGKALDVRVIVPEKLGWMPSQLRSPHFQQRFITGFHQALAQIAPTRMGPARELLPGVARGIAAFRQTPQFLRQAEQDPERAARDLARAVFSKLSEALPKPFRLMRDLSRTMSRFGSRGE